MIISIFCKIFALDILLKTYKILLISKPIVNMKGGYTIDKFPILSDIVF